MHPLRNVLLLATTTLTLLPSSTSANPTRPQQPLTPTRFEENDDTPLPVVIWHGLGDTYNGKGLQEVGHLIEDLNPGTFVYYVRLDESASSDRTATFYGNVTEQLAKVCADLATHPILSTAPAIDAVGFSQGGQFLRGYVERCNFPPVRNLMTFGAQHNGIIDYRTCSSRDWLCRGAMALLHGNTWTSFVQNRLVPAQYFRDPRDLENYLAYSNFLADINNEREAKNTTYAKHIAALDNLVLYIFEDDTTVIPKETGWFGEVNGTEDTPLRASKLYEEDWIGLRKLDKKGGLQFKVTPGEHMQLSEEVLTEAFTEFLGPYYKDPSPSSSESEEVGEL